MKADEGRQMLLDRAKKLFSQRGYYQTQISHIIKNPFPFCQAQMPPQLLLPKK